MNHRTNVIIPMAGDGTRFSRQGFALPKYKIPVNGRTHVSRYLAAFAPRFWPGLQTHWIEANGKPGALVTSDGHAVVLLSIEATEQGIDQVMWVMNPDKLAGFPVPAGA